MIMTSKLICKAGKIDRCGRCRQCRWRYIAGGGILLLDGFGALPTRVVALAIRFVADVLELTVGASAGATVVVTKDGCH